MNIVVTDYKEPTESTDPEINFQKEWACNFVQSPLNQWHQDCQLPPEQNSWIFAGLTEPATPIFYGLSKYTKKEKLPQQLIDEGRCYNFPNCEIDVNYLEYDVVSKDANGKEQRFHYVNSFSGDLPYLASNLKTCYTTQMQIDNQSQPVEVCQELVNFVPGK